jgi:hypothetical protein
MKIKHYSIFKDPIEDLNWELLRNNPNETSYYIPDNKIKYLKIVDVDKPSKFIEKIIAFCYKNNITNVFSIGSGIAGLEFQLKKFSKLKVIISDNNESIFRIKNFDCFDQVIKLDAFNDSYPVDSNTLVLFPRIDTEFTDDSLKIIFQKCYESHVKHILFIPAELLSIKIFLAELKVLLISLIKSKKRIFCGYARTYNSFKNLWSAYYHDVKLTNFDESFILKSNFHL